MTDFAVDVYQNEYLSEGAGSVDAIVTVTASGELSVGPAQTARAEVIIIDTSGSMGYPPTKLSAAKQATATAIDTLRDGTAFAVIAGSHIARQVYPKTGTATASVLSRGEAKKQIERLTSDGGTAIGSWLRLARQLFDGQPASAIKHAILLTDGNNQHETVTQLDDALTYCSGAFTCDARGVGTDWKVAEMRKVSQALLGTVDIVANPAGLEADFRAMAEASMGKAVADVALRLWTPQGATIRFVKQVEPTVADVTAMGRPSGPRSNDYPTGSWGGESRDYHVCVEVNPGGVGDEMLAARVSLVVDDQVLGMGLVRAVWTDDEALSTRINKEVAHYTGQAELAQAIQDGLEARREGDVDTATARLGRAKKLATESGNAAITGLLDKVLDEDPATGKFRLRQNVDDADEMTLDTQSSVTVRVGKARS
jgi:von Willebrand factor type A C-terminal domain/von Willebrand factor type A domain